MPHAKLIRILNYVWLVTLFPISAAVIVGSLGHNFALGMKTFLLIEFSMAVLSPLLGALLDDSRGTIPRRKKR
jgi:hypothetical protein